MKNQVQNNILEHTGVATWDEIIQKSDNLQIPSIFQVSKNTPSYNALKDNALSAIEDYIKEPRDSVGATIFIDGKVISNPIRFLTDHPKNTSESLEVWKNRILPNKSLVVKIDTVSTLSDELHYSLHDFLYPLFESNAIPLGGVAVSFEFGDHQWSPYGLEEDLTPKKKLTINTGKTKQVLYQWTPEKKKELGGLIMKNAKMQNFKEYVTDYSEKDELAENQMAIMLSQGIHITQHTGFYEKIQIRIGDLTRKELLEEMLFNIAAAAMSVEVRGKEASILPVYNANKHDEFTQEMLKDLKYSGNDLNISMRDLLRKSFKEICYARRSNQGFVGAIQSKEIKEVSAAFRNVSDNTKIKLKNTNFKIEYYSINNQTYLFMRGQKVAVKQSESVTDLIDTLNQGGVITWGTLGESNNWQLPALHKLIQLAYKFRVLEITNP